MRKWRVRVIEWCLSLREWCVKESGGEWLVHVEVSVVRE